MSRMNRRVAPRRPAYRGNLPLTHEGAPAEPEVGVELQLRRSLLACLLWEDTFYEDGEEIGKRIHRLAVECPPGVTAALAAETRHKHRLRHAPLLLLTALCRTGSGSSMVSEAIAGTIGRVDEIPELLATYWQMNGRDGTRGGKVAPKRVSAQLKRGMAMAFAKFDRHQVAKYRVEGRAVTLLDAMRVSGCVPRTSPAGEVLADLRAGELRQRETWESRLSAGEDKRETFADLLRQGKLGYMALLRNLRNMQEAGVDPRLVRDAILARKGARNVLPFRYVAAARACPAFAPEIERALLDCVLEMEPLDGTTAVLVDVSDSMNGRLSADSDLTRMDAAATLAAIIPGTLRMFAFSNQCVEVDGERGLAGVDAIKRALPHGGTYLGAAVDAVNRHVPHDRLIVLTDEQSHDRVPEPAVARGYMINVAPYRHGVGYGRWRRVDGFSEAVLTWIREVEAMESRILA